MRSESEKPKREATLKAQSPPPSACGACGAPSKTRFCSDDCRLVAKVVATGDREKSYLKTWNLGLRMGARGTVSPQTNVTGLAREGGVCIVASNLPESASRANECALFPGEAEALREFFLLLNEWNEAEDHHGN
jgi:hypothetical protein